MALKQEQIVASLFLIFAIAISISSCKPESPSAQQIASSCKRELLNANKTIAGWAENLESMVNESKLPASSRESVHKAANQVLDLIEDFGQQISVKSPSALARDLVTIRRNSNKMALEIYLHTFDMRWPHNSLQIGFTVERVQQACLDRQALQALRSEPETLENLLKGRDGN